MSGYPGYPVGPDAQWPRAQGHLPGADSRPRLPPSQCGHCRGRPGAPWPRLRRATPTRPGAWTGSLRWLAVQLEIESLITVPQKANQPSMLVVLVFVLILVFVLVLLLLILSVLTIRSITNVAVSPLPNIVRA